MDPCGIISNRINEILNDLRVFTKSQSLAGTKEIEISVNEDEAEVALTLYGVRENVVAEILASELLREIFGLVSVGVAGR